MGSLSNIPFSSFWKRLVQVSRTTNDGFDTNLRILESGLGTKSSLSLSDDQLLVQPQSDDLVATVDIKTNSGTSIFTADTSNKKILVGQSQVPVNTMYKEFGIYQLDVDAGYHQGLISNNMLIGNDDDDSWVATSIFGNDPDPALTLDVDTTNKPHHLAALLWFIEDNITIDACRFIATSESTSEQDLNFHLTSYTLDVSTNFGDLSAGLVISTAESISVKKAWVKTGTLSHVGSVDVDAGKVMVCTLESVSGGAGNEITASVVVKYHIR